MNDVSSSERSLALTFAWLMRSPTKVETSTEPDMLAFLRISGFRNGKAATGESSGTVTVYDCRMLGMMFAEQDPTRSRTRVRSTQTGQN